MNVYENPTYFCCWSVSEVIHSITQKMIEMGIKEEDIKNAFDKIFKSGMDKAWKI